MGYTLKSPERLPAHLTEIQIRHSYCNEDTFDSGQLRKTQMLEKIKTDIILLYERAKA